MGAGGSTRALLDAPERPSVLLPAPPRLRRAPSRPARSRYWGLLLLIVGLGLLVRVLCGLTDDVPTTDATAYVRSGESLWRGDGFTRDGAPELHFPPGAPAVLGGASLLLDDPLTATVVVTVVLGTTLLLPLAGIARSIGGDRAGLLAAAGAAIAPALTTLPANQGGGSEAPFTLLVLVATWITITLPRRSPRWLTGSAVALGALTGLAYLVRPEGLLIAVVLVPCLVAAARRVHGGDAPAWWRAGVMARTTLLLGAFAVALAVLAAPYVAHLHQQTGSWQLTAKTQDASLEAWRDVAERDRASRDATFYALDETGLAFEAGRSSLPDLVRADPGGYLGIVLVNVRSLLTEGIVRWALLPLPVVLLGVWGAWRTRGRRATRIVLAMAVVGLATPIAFFVLPRYLIPVAALLIALAGVGGARLTRAQRLPVLGLVGIALVASLLGGLGAPASFPEPREPTEHRIVGEWLEEHAAPEATVMTRNQVTEHYSGLALVPLPAAPLEDVLRFARHYGVDYLVVDEYRLRYLRPALDPLFEPGPWPGLRLVHTTEVEGRITRVFVLDPAPTGDTAEPPTDASFVADQRG